MPLLDVLDIRERLTPADHQTHRHYGFGVPRGCTALSIHVRYSPKFASEADSGRLVQCSVEEQAAALREHGVEPELVSAWARAWWSAHTGRIANLLTISVDDALGRYRGAAHRQPPEARLAFASERATPGLVAGPVPAGEWRLTVSVHTLVSPVVELSIQIGAETASSSPCSERSSA